jgi:DNA mismatch repair protein MutS2
MRLLNAGGEPPSVRFENVDDCLKRVRPIGAILDVDDLARVRDQLQATADARKYLTGNACTDYRALASLGEQLHDPAEILTQFRKVFDDELQVRDGASTRLAGIRREIQAIERRIRRRLEKLMHLAGDEDVYQDQYVATRNDRFVVPVRRELKSRVKGIIHDQSNSGATLFIEPDATVEDGNERVRLRLEERDEIRRILGMLSDDVRELSPKIRDAHGALIDYDVWLAVGRWAISCKCRFPTVGSQLVLKEARHPLLYTQFGREHRSDELVPLNLKLHPDCRTLAVTGANTGGKTVVLKTVGLITLMVHAGLPIPVADGSMVPAFDAVFADVGDEQSLAHNLSTFSGHLRNISEILSEVPGKRALVLLDELGSGTDPLEGGALGCAILQHLADVGALTLATTHLGIIKTWVHATEHMTNASVLFNRESLEPEYVLRLGTPGASHALTIARKLQLPASVTDAAENFMGADHKRLETILADIEEEQNSLRLELRDAKAARNKLKREQKELEAETRELREERKRLIRDARQEAAGIVSNTRKEMEKLLRNAGKLKGDGKESARELRKTLENRHNNIREGLARTAPKEQELPTDERAPRPGDRVWVDKIKDHAKLVKVSGKQCLVDLNGMQVQVPLKGVRLADQLPPDKSNAATKTTMHKPATQAPFELNLIGKRVDDALRELERAIDRGLVQGVTQMRVVHGFGTGTLRQAIHEYLRDAPGIEAYRLGTPTKDPGGQGATLVTLES